MQNQDLNKDLKFYLFICKKWKRVQRKSALVDLWSRATFGWEYDILEFHIPHHTRNTSIERWAGMGWAKDHDACLPLVKVSALWVTHVLRLHFVALRFTKKKQDQLTTLGGSVTALPVYALGHGTTLLGIYKKQSSLAKCGFWRKVATSAANSCLHLRTSYICPQCCRILYSIQNFTKFANRR